MTAGLLAVGDVVDGYRVEELTTADLVSETYRTTPVGSAAAGALELTVTRGTLPVDPEVRRRFTHEIARLTAVAHPALVAVHGGGVVAGRPYVVADAVTGTPLPAWLAGRGPLRGDAVELLRPVAQALDEAHATGVLHRELSASSVVVDRRGRARLRFPAVVRAAAADGTDGAAATGDLGDTLAGLAPEQRAGGPVSHRTDVYAFGAVLYQATTGHPLDVESVLLGRPLRPVAASVPGVPPEVDEVFRSALATDPAGRQASARAVTDELAAAFTATTPPRSRRRRVLVALGAAVAVLAVAVAVVPRDRAVEDVFPPVVERDAVVGEPIAVGADPADVEAGAGSVWVSTPDGHLTRIDPRTGATRRIAVGGQPGQIVVTDEAVWVRNLGDRITRVDTATEAVSAPILSGGGRVSGMTVGGGSVWLSHSADNTVTRVDATTLEPVGRAIGVGGGPRAMEFDGGTVYVLNADDSTVTRIDAAAGTTVGEPLQLGEGLGGVEVDDGTVYVAAGGGVTPVAEDTFTAGVPFDLRSWSYFEVADGTMWVVYDTADEVRRLDLASREPRGDPVTGIGREVGRARFAFGMLWLTLPSAGTVVRIAPAR